MDAMVEALIVVGIGGCRRTNLCDYGLQAEKIGHTSDQRHSHDTLFVEV
jgi:hypothetical protein